MRDGGGMESRYFKVRSDDVLLKMRNAMTLTDAHIVDAGWCPRRGWLVTTSDGHVTYGGEQDDLN